ncbi:hypothetical protein [Dubosiella newyorkensis]|uniref:hypothetical protein n=1 Tax=Dubosiella newyorkensis TaxID=1862672 RepID=UPI003F66F8AF
MAKMDYDDLQSYYWMDVYAYGRYPRAALAQLKSMNVAPHFEAGDEEILKLAAQNIDFMGSITTRQQLLNTIRSMEWV